MLYIRRPHRGQQAVRIFPVRAGDWNKLSQKRRERSRELSNLSRELGIPFAGAGNRPLPVVFWAGNRRNPRRVDFRAAVRPLGPLSPALWALGSIEPGPLLKLIIQMLKLIIQAFAC